jgi:hypothetical protein
MRPPFGGSSSFKTFHSMLRGSFIPALNSENAFGVINTVESYPFASAAALSFASRAQRSSIPLSSCDTRRSKRIRSMFFSSPTSDLVASTRKGSSSVLPQNSISLSRGML